MADCIRSKRVKTRKPHRCWGCWQQQPAGSEIMSTTSADGGEINTVYWCDVCVEYMRRHCQSDDEFSEREIYDNDRETWEEIKAELAKKEAHHD
jgi:hypothetical protein